MSYQIYKKGFKTYLQLERNLSENTVYAYMHDVELLIQFLEEEKESKSFDRLILDDLVDFISYINKMELGAHTQSRVISGIKAFYKYLLIEQIIEVDPSELLESPRLGRKLPDVLNPEEIGKLIDTAATAVFPSLPTQKVSVS